MERNETNAAAASMPAAAPTKAAGVTLSDGRRVTFPRKPIGRDLVKAAAAAQGQGQTAVFMALAATLAVVTPADGGAPQLITYEDVCAMDLMDVINLIGEVVGNVSPGLVTLFA